MKSTIKEIINSLNKTTENKGEYAQFNDKSYQPIKITKENFHEIKDIKSEKKIAFIDAGNAEILKAPNFSLQLIRVYCTIYQENKRIKSRKKEFYILTSATKQNNNIVYSTEFFGIDSKPIAFDSFDPTLKQGAHRIQISSIGNAIRRFAEIETAKQLIEELNPQDTIVLDGDLKATITDEIGYLNSLINEAAKKNIQITALSKTSQLFTEQGSSLINTLNEISPKIPWYYFPLVKISSQLHKADMYILKLNKNSKHTFKFEVCNSMPYSIDEISSMLKNNSKDPVFLGYPYGLIEADKFARVSNKEQDYLKTIFSAKLGKNLHINPHDILDSISY